mgnify:CR=1 FL=1
MNWFLRKFGRMVAIIGLGVGPRSRGNFKKTTCPKFQKFQKWPKRRLLWKISWGLVISSVTAQLVPFILKPSWQMRPLIPSCCLICSGQWLGTQLWTQQGRFVLVPKSFHLTSSITSQQSWKTHETMSFTLTPNFESYSLHYPLWRWLGAFHAATPFKFTMF